MLGTYAAGLAARGVDASDKLVGEVEGDIAEVDGVIRITAIRLHMTAPVPEAEREGDRLTRAELVTMCNLLLIAGNVTTTDLIGNGMRCLIERPDQVAILRERPELLPNAVEEMLRFDPPVTTSGRIAPTDFEMDGVPIPKGHSISVNLAAANRDPAVYPDPDRFDVTREDTHHQSFGGGAHLCLGAHLARLESQIAIGKLVQRVSEIELLEARTTWGRSLFRVPGRIPVRFRAVGD